MKRPQIHLKRRVYVRAYDSVHLIERAKANMATFSVAQSNFHLLLYAALDVRLCIETTLFEYIQLITNENPGRNFEKLYRAKALKQAILELEPDFERKLEFGRLVNRWVVIPDLDRLSKWWDRFGDYLHRPRQVPKTSVNNAWWLTLWDMLNEATSHLWDIHANPRAYIKLNEKSQQLYRKYVNGELDSEQLKKEIENLEAWAAE